MPGLKNELEMELPQLSTLTTSSSGLHVQGLERFLRCKCPYDTDLDVAAVNCIFCRISKKKLLMILTFNAKDLLVGPISHVLLEKKISKYFWWIIRQVHPKRRVLGSKLRGQYARHYDNIFFMVKDKEILDIEISGIVCRDGFMGACKLL